MSGWITVIFLPPQKTPGDSTEALEARPIMDDGADAARPHPRRHRRRIPLRLLEVLRGRGRRGRHRRHVVRLHHPKSHPADAGGDRQVSLLRMPLKWEWKESQAEIAWATVVGLKTGLSFGNLTPWSHSTWSKFCDQYKFLDRQTGPDRTVCKLWIQCAAPPSPWTFLNYESSDIGAPFHCPSPVVTSGKTWVLGKYLVWGWALTN